MMQPKWQILSPDPQQVATLVKGLGCQPGVAAALVNRGICTPEEAGAFLNPSLAQVRSPFSMKGINRAVDRIMAAVRRREKVLIFGDYDADGVTATALLFEFLTSLGAEVDYYIPDRLTEGYGLSCEYIEGHAEPYGVSLIITVDCGISSHEAVSRAREAGIDVIITDHHETTSPIPEALSVLNPKQPRCTSGFSWLAGVGVAFNLALALRKRLRDEGHWQSGPEPNLKAACDLVALGTVADMVPLLNENRIFVKAGLEVLTSHPRPGIRALLQVCGNVNRRLESHDVAYKIAPRLNAPGRLRHASAAVRLLTASDMKTAHSLAVELNQEHARRQKMEQEILSEISCSLEADPALLENRALVLDNHGWHQGVIGLVASRLVERYHRPVVIITVANGIGKGSVRSPAGFDVYEGLCRCAGHLERFGGHKRAAGLTLKSEKIPAFRRDFERVVCERTTRADMAPQLVIDGKINPSEISGAFANELEAFAPFGAGNPEPLFLLSDVEILNSRVVGRNHLQMRLASRRDKGSELLEAIYFNGSEEARRLNLVGRLLCHVRWNRWRDSERIQLVVRDME